MSKTPDLSAFPIPRKGGAKPIVADDLDEAENRGGEGGAPDDSPTQIQAEAAPLTSPRPGGPGSPASATTSSPATTSRPRPPRPERGAVEHRYPPPPQPPVYGQVVATTVKLDESRYLRLMEAGKPSRGRLKRRTIQDMLIEALDEWFERRQL